MHFGFEYEKYLNDIPQSFCNVDNCLSRKLNWSRFSFIWNFFSLSFSLCSVWSDLSYTLNHSPNSTLHYSDTMFVRTHTYIQTYVEEPTHSVIFNGSIYANMHTTLYTLNVCALPRSMSIRKRGKYWAEENSIYIIKNRHINFSLPNISSTLFNVFALFDSFTFWMRAKGTHHVHEKKNACILFSIFVYVFTSTVNY